MQQYASKEDLGMVKEHSDVKAKSSLREATCELRAECSAAAPAGSRGSQLEAFEVKRSKAATATGNATSSGGRQRRTARRDPSADGSQPPSRRRSRSRSLLRADVPKSGAAGLGGGGKHGTTPAADYDVMALHGFDMDRLKMAALLRQDAPSALRKEKLVAQPLTFAWKIIGGSLTPSSAEAVTAAVKTQAHNASLPLLEAAGPRGEAAINMYYLANAAIFYRAYGAAPYSDDEMLDRARRVATSVQELLALVEELLAEAAAGDAIVDDPSAEEDMTPDGVVDPAVLRQQRRTLRIARAGEPKKAVLSAKPSVVADSSRPEVKQGFAGVTPQVGATAKGGVLTPELMADVPDAAPFKPTKDTFDVVMRTAPRERAPGPLHDTFETLQMVFRHGAKAALYAFIVAFFAGAVSCYIVALIRDLRAVLFYKDAERTKLRPIGIGEALRRIVCKCMARQERKVWNAFCTKMLPEDEEAFQEAKAEAEADVARGEGNLAAAKTAGDSARVAVAKAALKASGDTLKSKSKRPNFPVNYLFAASACAMVAHTVQAWIERVPDDHVLKTDKVNMYNESSRPALFHALDEVPAFHGYKPCFRAFYETPARIFLVRAEGELTLPVSCALAAGAIDEERAQQLAEGGVGAPEAPLLEDGGTWGEAVRAAVCHIRSERGTQQGDVLGGFGACIPYHLSLHRTNKQCPDMRIVCMADDTICGGPPSTLYRDFETLRANELEDCDLRENDSKLAALAPSGGVAGIPAAIVAAQGGEVHGLKVVGAFVGPNTAAGIEWRRAALAAAMADRLEPLDYLDAISCSVASDARQLRLMLLRQSSSRMPVHWEQIMPPFITEPVMRDVVDARLRQTLESIADVSAATPAQLERWWEQSQLPTGMGGTDVGGNVGRCKPAYCGAMFACLPRLADNCSVLHGLDLATADLPMLDTFRSAYDDLCAVRAEVELAYQTEFNDKPWWNLRREKIDHCYHPDQLPRKLDPIADVLNPKSVTRMPPQRMLNRVVQHQRWLQCLRACEQADVETPHPVVAYRETVRFISVSQPTAAGTIDIVPDGGYATRVENLVMSTYLQRRGGLNLSIASAAFSTAEAHGEAVDRLGDEMANKADHNRRHNGTLNKVYDMMAAVAVGQVVKGDKTDRDDMALLNSGTVADVVELEGDEDSGSDSLVEVKVPSPLVANLGKGGKGKGGSGTEMAVGHLYAHGNTDEPYRVGVLGVKSKGRKGGPHFNHWTGRGYVRGQQGKYHDALSKGARVTVMLVESTGAISARSLRYVSHLTRRSRGPNARDATRYGRNRMSATGFYTHHTQRLSMAAACGDVRGIMESVRGLKQRMLALGSAAGALV